MSKPTGISTYARHVARHLGNLDPVFLTARHLDFPGRRYKIPSGLTPEQGARGHARRLLWTQLFLPRILNQLRARTLFSPLPEVPLGMLDAKFRYAVTAYDLTPLRFPQKATPLLAYQKFYVPAVLRRADRILAISETTARDLRSFFDIDSAKIDVVHLAYDRKHYYDRGLERSNYFIYIGRQEQYKNLERIVRAMAKVSDDTELHIVGKVDERYAPALRWCARELAIEHRIKFRGYVPEAELPEAIGRAIGLVFPSLWEGFGLPILEAMACGTPTITSNYGAMAEVAGEASLLVDPYSVDAIASAMQRLWDDSSMSAHLRRSGLDRAQQFSWEKTGRETCEALRFLAV